MTSKTYLGDGPTRRSVLAGTAAVALGAIAGCLGEDDAPEPISIAGDQDCDNCTMGIGHHPGPVGQAHYENPDEVVGDDRPAQFCSSLCTYAFTFEQADRGIDPQVTYVTDYSTVDYSITTSDGDLEISNHLDAETFATPADLALIADSEVLGAMGRSIIGFSDGDDADEFRAEYGGEEYAHEDVTMELVMSLMS
ncbi:nitrous oxide reductase accessory protein NosL [Natrarchaeobius chitinivorans]|uniref:Nitrous oxide reductase accessory protein NosL n=1 Tax=Natrarchaeobius chitinivorans TaxID=1679083 RepID=A0A3N6PC13_NATCH|nr:nitrous oxide reductase accessory protein NosL [Natrarchaeobius chitinivorans]RQG94205.1 nitrous oxide reductase accessory protein NosL [Natrarchaeobius chitinivorans]